MQPTRHHGARTGAEQVGLNHGDRHAVGAQLAVEWPGFAAREGQKHRQMILQIAADGQIHHRIDPHVAQMRGRPDAGQHQQLRGGEGAAGDDDVTRGFRPRQPAVLHVGDSRRGGTA